MFEKMYNNTLKVVNDQIELYNKSKKKNKKEVLTKLRIIKSNLEARLEVIQRDDLKLS